MEQREERLSLLRLSRVATEEDIVKEEDEVNLFGLCRIATEEDEIKEEYESQTCLSDTESLERKQQYLRRQFVKEQWKCMNHCPSCGKCRILKGKDPEELYADFIDGKRTYMDITLEIRKR